MAREAPKSVRSGRSTERPAERSPARRAASAKTKTTAKSTTKAKATKPKSAEPESTVDSEGQSTSTRQSEKALRGTPADTALGGRPADTKLRGASPATQTAPQATQTAPHTHRPAGTDTWPEAEASPGLLPVPVDREPLTDPRRSDVDEWGRSEHLRSILRTIVDPIYRHWFRAEWENFDRIPTEGGALLVGNHAGAIPSDAATIMHGIETELGRPVYTLADEFFKKLPLINIFWQRLGGVQAHPDNAYRLLREQGQLVLTFPEGNKGPGKHFSERYRLRRFGRGGFVEIALRAGVPIIPIAVLGAEESMPIVYKSPTLAKLTGLPYFPITANMLLLGPLGIVTYLPAKFRLRVLEPITFDEPPDQPRYSRSHIMDTAEMIRQRIQDALYDMLRKRESVWRG